MKKILFLFAGIFIINISLSQKHPDFSIIDQAKTSSVKNQYYTGTCWSFTTTSFIETEAMRCEKAEFDLSEMYFVYYAFLDKANDYIRLHGKAYFTEGGQAHDVINVVKRFGLLPESVFNGINYNSEIHNHTEMVKNLNSIIENAVKSKEKLPKTWYNAYKGVLDSYLGTVPKTFIYEGKEYTPQTFNEQIIGFNPEDYIELTSYIHHPFYELIDLELPDNWSHDRYYNVPVNELIEIMNYALKSGYSVAWDGDLSEKGFNMTTEKLNLSEDDIKAIKETSYQKYRQKTFDDYTTTDDHLMHITGKVKDKNGKIFYLTKNSWGIYNEYGGYLYMSEEYIKIKTIAFMIHKDAVPDKIAVKLGLK